MLLAHPDIRHPGLARQAGIEGTAVVEAVLDTLGHVTSGSARVVRVRVRVPVTFAIRR